MNRTRSIASIRRLIVACVVLGFVTPTFADAGIPMLALVWPSMWALLVPVILIEALFARRLLRLGWSTSLKLSAVTNAASTLVGIPITWALLFVLELILDLILGDFVPTSRWWGFVLFPLFAAWIAPPASHVNGLTIVFEAAAMLCIPFFLTSIWMEYRVGVWFLGCSVQKPQVWSWSKRANTASYGSIAAALAIATAMIAVAS